MRTISTAFQSLTQAGSPITGVVLNNYRPTMFQRYYYGYSSYYQYGDYLTETAVPHLSLHDIRAFSVFLPERAEQNAIGDYFQNLDALINQHQQQITKLNHVKQACLGKMFV